MADDDLAHIRAGVEKLTTDLAVHDSKVAQYIERIVSAEERVADAVDRVASATVEIKAAVVQQARNGNGGSRASSIQLDRKTLIWLVGLALAGSAALGGGSELAHRVFDTLLFPGAAHIATERGPTP